MQTTQPGILAEETKLARYLEFSIDSTADIKEALLALASAEVSDGVVTGIGQSLVDMLGKSNTEGQTNTLVTSHIKDMFIPGFEKIIPAATAHIDHVIMKISAPGREVER